MRTRIAGLFTGQATPMPGDGRLTGIFKQPVSGRIHVGAEGLYGDVQADLTAHGGPEKALHHFPAATYARFTQVVPEAHESFVPGAMGENISTDDYAEADVCIGDVYAFGSARIQLCQPRTPCWKIDARFKVEGLARAIQAAGIAGWYYRVLEQGEVEIGDTLELQERNPEPVSVERFWQLGHALRPDLDELSRLGQTPGLATQWQQRIRARLVWLRKNVANTES